MSSLRKKRILLALMIGFVNANTAMSGPEHIEGGATGDLGDAGSFAATAQPTFKRCPDKNLDALFGNLVLVRRSGPFDLEDMYRIRIVDPDNFSVRTWDPSGGVYPGFDTQLWLFRIDGSGDAIGLLANDDEYFPCPGGNADCPAGTLCVGGVCEVGWSFLQAQANDGTGQVIPGSGEYLLAVTAFGNSPESVGGPIFSFGSRTEVSGPDGPGAALAHTAWTGGGPANPGGYALVEIIGAEAVATDCIPTVSGWGLVILTLVLVTGGKIRFGS